MSIARHSMFEPTISESFEMLYQKACHQESCKTTFDDKITSQDVTNTFAKIFAYKFNISPNVFYSSELLEESVLKLALSTKQCLSIPEDINVQGKASWMVHSYLDRLDSALVIRYPSLSLKQREEIVKALNNKYDSIVTTYESYYANGYCAENKDGILFNKSLFCKLVIPDLIKQFNLEAQYEPKRQAVIK